MDEFEISDFYRSVELRLNEMPEQLANFIFIEFNQGRREEILLVCYIVNQKFENIVNISILQKYAYMLSKLPCF